MSNMQSAVVCWTGPFTAHYLKAILKPTFNLLILNTVDNLLLIIIMVYYVIIGLFYFLLYLFIHDIQHFMSTVVVFKVLYKHLFLLILLLAFSFGSPCILKRICNFLSFTISRHMRKIEFKIDL